MYKVKNNTIGKVVLGDLNLVINFNTELDLESRIPRDEIEQSKNLKQALEKKILLLVKDTKESAADQFKALEERLRASILEEISKNKTDQPIQNNDNSDNINQKFDLILQAIKNNTNYSTNTKSVLKYEDEEDEKKMLEMHKKSVERISKNSSANIQSSESKINSSDLDNKTSELEGLL